VRRHHIPTIDAQHTITVKNADGSINGYVKKYVEIEMDLMDDDDTWHIETIRLQVINLGGKHDVFLRFDWLEHHNPLIDWREKELRMAQCPDTCQLHHDKRSAGSLRNYTRAHGQYDEDGFKGEHMRAAFQTKSTQIAAQAAKEETVEIPPHYMDYKDIFEKKEFDKLPERRPWDHAINLLPYAEQDLKLRGKIYPMSPSEKVELDKFIDEHLASGRIRKSTSPIAASFFHGDKKDGGLCPIQDYRRINSMTIKGSWPLPVIHNVINKIQGAKFFSKFDVRWGFNNVRIKEGDEWKAAFICDRGLFEPLVMFFGLCNSPATFQHMMDHIFDDLIRQNKIIVYLDDILIFSNTIEEHREITREVLRRVRENKLFLKLEKCKFEQTTMNFLGMVVGNGQVMMDPIKTKAISEWTTPKNLREVRSFMQFCNFYRTFIPNFADITVPFNELTKKDVKFEWGDRQEKAFQTLKDIIRKDIALALPVPGARFRLKTDASDYAAGAVLHQIIEGKPRPLAFFSKTFDPAQRNYDVREKELLAIVLALAFWRHFLQNGLEFDIWTDHLNLLYYAQPQKLNRRQSRWQSELQNYNFKIHHRPGKLNIIADTLS